MKRSGFGHKDEKPGEGELAMFCAVCPQPGINLPENWEDDKEQWKYIPGFVADGNFVCNHLFGRPGKEDIWLQDGLMFMAQKNKYYAHLSKPQRKDDVSLRALHSFILQAETEDSSQ